MTKKIWYGTDAKGEIIGPFDTQQMALDATKDAMITIPNGGMPQVGHYIEFADDAFTDKGPCSGKISAVNGDEITCDVSDEPQTFSWSKIADCARPAKDGGWIIDRLTGKDYVAGLDAQMAADRATVPRVRAQFAYIALDKASLRRKDADGRLHVEITNISKANVCPYRGDEIPDYRKFDLDPKVIYWLYRDPEELERAAPTFNNIPLLSEHVPVSVDAPQQDLVVGSLGTDAEFHHPYLRNSLVVWVADAIEGIETDDEEDKKRELSAAYRYRLDMTPGVAPNGQRYDGVMRDIIGNHVALVTEGRAGPDVIVGDSHLELPMTAKNTTKLTRFGALAYGSIMSSILPMLAKDAKPAEIKLAAHLQGLTSKTFPKRKVALDKVLRLALKGKLAKDADIEDVTSLLDALGEKVEDKEEMKQIEGDADVDPDMDDDDMTLDGDPSEKVKAYLKDKGIDDEVIAGIDACFGKAQDEPTPFAGKPADPADKGESITKGAMDAAIAAAVKKTRADMRAAEEARTIVRPLVGDIDVALDTAEDIFRHCLEQKKVDVEGVHPSAFRALVVNLPKPEDRPRRLASDAAPSMGSAADFATRFPMARPQSAGR